MNELPNDATGLESAKSGSNADHPVGIRVSPLTRASWTLEEAARHLSYSSRQEAQAALCCINEAISLLEEAGKAR